ncbi:hypothetical protein HK413_00965 [Mucilaginibacter sp. S1162]|uniref:Uncharacterized protein n=1 Tax=Mucilaginibacter humi TaxID=2732510 RepID=A0ABX1W1J8_9SPHI|nr:hypothetical protein [Mucilaginibacter humi]NNU33109.1 hypothetical protein [Mucilaginibacter humi]
MMTLSDYKIDELLYHRVDKGLGGFLNVWLKKLNILLKGKIDGIKCREKDAPL